MSIKSIGESIELDQRQLKCLLSSFEKEPDEALKSLILRNIRESMAHLKQLHSLVEDCAFKPDAAVVAEEVIKQEKLAPESSEKAEEHEAVQIPLALNDTFLFARLLFGGNVHQLLEFWEGFSTCQTYEQAEHYLKDNVKTASEEDMAECLTFLEQFYSNK